MNDATVNVACRREFALVLRRFMAGRMTTDRYESEYFRLVREHGDDAAVQAVFDAAWYMYDDIFPHRMTGRHRLTKEARTRVARWILFLRTDAPFLPGASSADATSTPKGEHRLNLWHFLGGIARIIAFVLSMLGASMIGVIGAVVSFVVWLRNVVELENGEGHEAWIDPDNCWPFRSVADLHAAASMPTYLHGGDPALSVC